MLRCGWSCWHCQARTTVVCEAYFAELSAVVSVAISLLSSRESSNVEPFQARGAIFVAIFFASIVQAVFKP